MKLYPYYDPRKDKRDIVWLIATIFGIIILGSIIAAVFGGCKTNAEVDAKAGLINDFREMLKEVNVKGDEAEIIDKSSAANTQVQGITELQLYIIIAAILFGIPVSVYVMNKLQIREMGRNGSINRRK